MKKKRNGVLLMSAGLDSFILWRLLDRPPAVYVSLGHQYEELEVNSLRALTELLRERGLFLRLRFANRIYLGDLEEQDAHIPLRNSLLLHVAALEYPDAEAYYLGALRGEGGRDKSKRFYRLLSKMMSHSEGRRIKAYAPAIHWSKYRLVREYLRRWPNDDDMLGWTTSCHAPEIAAGTIGCGKCNGCFRRWVSMSLNGIDETYETAPHVYARQTWMESEEGRAELWRYLRAADMRELPQIIGNNYNAWKAIRHAERRDSRT